MPRFNRTVLLYNAQAGQSMSDAMIGLTTPSLAEESNSLELVQTSSPEEFTEACIQAAESAEVLFVVGGDGTIHLAVQALTTLENPPILGILPGGTCNDFARTLGIPLSLDEAASSLVQGDIKEIDTARINGNAFLNFAGIGIITDASSNIDPHLKERYGKLSYFMSGLRSIRQAEPFSATVEVDGIVHLEEGVLILVMNGKSIGTHMVPLQLIDPMDGLLDVFIVQTSSIAAVREWFSLAQPEVLTDELEHVTHYQGRRIVIRTEQEMDVDTDGEIYLKTPLEIEIEPKKLKMLVPKLLEEEDLS
ncbi:diacylglycerol kinase family lipid kinase [Planococcus sp. N028]|uniref:Diacylglycerol kinase family lipid kinase n=1 Tax=Planococcus shixiaomingii TaxID=3058393 RepID=A0ABT8N1X1_9BACL|nr:MULTISPECIES: diacylglycerol kinase family protein [unclassified Planococcus (in: firmicutes)]MDN7241892.1 diacylglycerol kinase family lipid kinase [Planococcus sp. N028]WKA54177.1 diacylglycerol kinase family lipid kinase [Planococcus sp. N022]